MAPLWTAVAAPVVAAATYYLTAVVQTVFHRWFGHQPRLEAIHHDHVTGHHAIYSGEHLLSDTWEASERHVLWYYSLPLLPLALGAWLLLPLPLFLVHLASVAATVWLHLWLHRQYHLRATWLNRYAWFRRKQRLHFVHHRQATRNYAIIEYRLDRLMGTFADERHHRLEADAATQPAGGKPALRDDHDVVRVDRAPHAIARMDRGA